MPDTNIVHIENFGTANTPTAPDALRIDFVVDGVRHDNGSAEISCSVHGTNSAVFDNAWAAARVVLLLDGAEVWSFITRTDQQCPGRGFGGATQRDGQRTEGIPQNIQFNQVGVKVANIDDAGGETLNWAALVELAATIIITAASAAA